jgi:hypothetical protein
MDGVKWIKSSDELPSPDDRIIVKFVGCKLGNYLVLTVREGEGLGGWFEEWAYFDKKAEG